MKETGANNNNNNNKLRVETQGGDKHVNAEKREK